MEFKDYQFSLTVDGEVFEPYPPDIGFSLKDSIHELFPHGIFSYPDSTSLMNEYRLFAEGQPMEIEFGFIEETPIKNSYTVDSTETTKIGKDAQGIMAGHIQINLNHSTEDFPGKQSKAYEGLISDVVQEYIDEANASFSSTEVVTTGNKGIWYQTWKSARDFLNMLAKNAYSDSQGEVPWFVFIDSNHAFRFVDYSTMMQQSVVAELVYHPYQEDFIEENQIEELFFYTTGTDNHRKDWVVRRIWDNLEDNVQTDEEILATDRSNESGDVPFIGDPGNVQDVRYYGSWYYEDKFMDENIKGRDNNRSKAIFFPERLLLRTRLKPEVLAGTTVNVTVASQDSAGVTDSLYFEGKWLVEESNHVWDGSASKGYSQLIVSRNRVNLPNDYLVKDKLFK